MVEAERRTDFGDLVRERRAELGLSLRELEQAAVDPETGEPARFGWINKVEKHRPTDAPSEEQLRALAVGLRLPLRSLQQAAAAQYFGMVWSEDRSTRVLVARYSEMSPEEKAQLEAIAETFSARKR